MSDYDIEIEVIWDMMGDPVGFAVDTPSGRHYEYTVEELEGTNLLDLIEQERITVYSQKEILTREEHEAIYGW